MLLPPALVYSMAVLILIAAALANPQMLLPLFLFACVGIYSFTAFYFLIKGIEGGQSVQAGLKDWIKVNAIVSFVFALLVVMQFSILKLDPALMAQVTDAAFKQQQGNMQFSKPEFAHYITVILNCFAVHGVLLIVHIVLTLILLRRYSQLFISRQ